MADTASSAAAGTGRTFANAERPVIALAGNPNSGKTSLFNLLTGLNRKVANFPGITVERVVGSTRLPDGRTADVLDLPGSYSLFARSEDERVARNLAMNQLKRRSVERRALKLRPEPDDVAPQTPAEGEETRAAVQSALETLPLDQREAVCLKVWGECSWVQIGQTLGVSEDTAARLFARGLQAIAPRLKELSP